MSELKVNKLSPESGTTLTLGDAGDTIVNNGTASGFLPTAGSSGNVLTSDGTNWASTAAAGGVTVDYFAATSGSQSIASNVDTKVLFPTEVSDSGSFYDTSNARVTPPAGAWILNFGVTFGTSLTDGKQILGYIYKNGSTVLHYLHNTFGGGTSEQVTLWGTELVETNGTDYFEAYIYHTFSGTKGLASGRSYFNGHTLTVT